MAGETRSTNFPTTADTYDTSYVYFDAFVSKLNADLSSLLSSTYLGGYNMDYASSIIIDSSGNVYVAGDTQSSDFPVTAGVYDNSFNSGYYYDDDNDNYEYYYDAFISKLNSNLTSLLASTYLGGSSGDESYSIIDFSGSVYITGHTMSVDFPTTTSSYDTSYNGGNGSYGDAFISKLNEDLTSLLASIYLGGSSGDYGNFIAKDSNGNVYVTGVAGSTDFPTTTGAYDTSYGSYGDAFVSKLNGDLTSLLASTYLGGSSGDSGRSLNLDSGGNIYVIGETNSSNFLTTTGAYDTSYNKTGDAFVSKLNGDLTSLIASTYLGGSSLDIATSIAIDTSDNIYVTGETHSSNFPISSSAYDTSYNSGDGDAFISKFDSNLSVDSSAVSTPTPTPTPTPTSSDNFNATLAFDSDSYSLGAYAKVTLTDVDKNTSITTAQTLLSDVFIQTSSANSTKVRMVETGADTGTFKGSIQVASSGGTTEFSRIQATAGDTLTITYIDVDNTTGSLRTITDTASVTAGTTTKQPTATTESTTNITSNSATLNGTVNANSIETYAWFEYGTKSGTYGSVSTTQKVTGTSDTTVSISISGLSSATKYYYRIAAQNNSGTSYGSEKSFTTSDTSAPTGSISINGNDTYTKSTNVNLSFSATDNSGVTGYYISTSSSTPSASAAGWTSATSTTSYSANVSYTLSSGDGEKTVYVWYKDNSENISNVVSDPIESVKLRLKAVNSEVLKKTTSDEDGLFEFTDLDADTYIITAIKKGYKRVKQTITLEAGEEKDIEIVMKKVIRKGR